MLAFDFETHPVAPALQVPPAVCMSFAHSAGAEVLRANEGIDLLTDHLSHGGRVVGANTAFDVLVSVYSAPDPAAMMILWVRAYEENRVTDVLLRQPLIDLSVDRWAHRYNLASVCAQCGVSVPDKANPWRIRFAELDGLEPSTYPPEARSYSLEDAVTTLACYETQERRRFASPYFPGRDVLADEHRQARGALALKDMSSCGVRTDPETVAKFRLQTEGRLAELRETLLREGLLRPKHTLDREAIGTLLGLPKTPSGAPSFARRNLEGSPLGRLVLSWPSTADQLLAMGLASVEYQRDTKAAGARIVTAYAARGQGHPTTDTGDPALDGDACEKSRDPVLRQYHDYTALTKTLSTDFDLLERGAREPLHPFYRPLQQTGRTSTGADSDGSAKGNLQNLPRHPGVRECYCPRPGNVFFDADFPAIELRTFAQICLWLGLDSALAKDLNAGEDPHLRIAAAIENEPYAPHGTPEHKAQKKRLGSQRTAGKGVNFGRKGGMGPDKFADYAWNNYRVDCTPIGARWLREDPQAFARWVERRAQWQHKDDPAGLAHWLAWWATVPAQALAAMADEDLDRYLDQAGIRLAAYGAQRLITLHDALTPEMRGYTAWVKTSQRPGTDRYDLVQPWSGRCVAGLSYTDRHNYPFQGLAADLAKVWLWKVFKARWTEGDPLYRLPICLFTHDSVTGEAPSDRAESAAMRLKALADEAAHEVLPDIATDTEPALMTRLSKMAEPLVEDGHLVPWDPWEQCAKAWGEAKDLASLREQGWPEYVIRDVTEVT